MRKDTLVLIDLAAIAADKRIAAENESRPDLMLAGLLAAWLFLSGLLIGWLLLP